MASVLKVDKLDPQSGTALEIGTSGDTISVPSGATLDISASTLTPPATMPASSGVNLTALNATQLTSGTIPDARFTTLPAVSGANLTSLTAGNISSGTVPTARLGSGSASSSVFLAGDSSWAAAGEANQPYFWAYAYATQSGVSDATWTVVDFPGEYYDSASAYDTTTMKFTPQTAGIYHIGGMASSIPDSAVTQLMVAINKNAAADPIYAPHLALGSANLTRWQGQISGLIHFNGSTDYVQMMVYIAGQDGYVMGHNGYTNFWGYLVST